MLLVKLLVLRVQLGFLCVWNYHMFPGSCCDSCGPASSSAGEFLSFWELVRPSKCLWGRSSRSLTLVLLLKAWIGKGGRGSTRPTALWQKSWVVLSCWLSLLSGHFGMHSNDYNSFQLHLLKQLRDRTGPFCMLQSMQLCRGWKGEVWKGISCLFPDLFPKCCSLCEAAFQILLLYHCILLLLYHSMSRHLLSMPFPDQYGSVPVQDWYKNKI